MSNNKLDSTGLGTLWDRFYSLIKLVTGDVKVSSKGTLQSQIDSVSTKVEDCFQSVSDGKTLVANAITGKGVTTSADAEFATMATNIKNIKTTPTLQSKTVTLDTSKTSATLTPDKGYDGLSQAKASITTQTKSVNLSTSQQVVKPDSGKVLSQVTVPAVTGTAALKDVVAGKTFNSETAGVGKTGTLPDKRGTTVDAAAVEQDDDYTYFTVPTEAVYDAKSKIRTMSSNLGNLDYGDFISYKTSKNEISEITLNDLKVGSVYEICIHTSKIKDVITSYTGCDDFEYLAIDTAYGARRLMLANFKTSAETVNIALSGIGEVSYILRKLT